MRILPTILLLSTLGPALAQPVVIGHAGLQPLDRKTLERIYTGRIVEIGGVRVTPVNLPQGNELREAFLRHYLSQDENKYTGYWTVRRYVGKGTPPPELPSSAEVVEFVSKTEGAIGYVESVEVPEGVQILLRSP
ncbi:hypothetical protein [Thiorhodococcus minor]|uniref:Phosphate ABC transporter substrate-binding protein n=1 Tax=Thiorhodococcus minor TaxID=57489 RepID=A0A6M0JZP0_9GAMM|nr:hypothetical protein [Thiorhodococcus minor]NEV62609.1 hypothetical protein [Thiorhodococcus minor]